MNRTGCVLQIGGSCPPRLLVPLCFLIARERVGLDWGEHSFDPGASQKTRTSCRRDLLNALDADGHLTLYNDDARGGMMYDLEQWLRVHRIPFTRFSDDTGECEPTRTDFRPDQPDFDTPVDASRDTLIPAAPIKKVIHQLQSASRPPARRIQAALRTLRRLTGETIPPLPPFTLVSTTPRR